MTAGLSLRDAARHGSEETGAASLGASAVEHFEEYLMYWLPAGVVLGAVAAGIGGVHNGLFVGVLFSAGVALLELI